MAAQTEPQHNEPEKPLVYEPPDLRGRRFVERVTSEYRQREDECLADKLQNEEFAFHFGLNKDQRKLGQLDTKEAKKLYFDELQSSGLLSKEELETLCSDDNYLAEEVSKRLNEELKLEEQRKQALEMQDEEFARYLEAKEKDKIEMERRRRLELRLEHDREAARRLQEKLNNENPDEEIGAVGWNIDMEVGSTHPKTKEELEKYKDEEVARKLQHQEDLLERRLMEEEHDRRLAKKLQREEAKKYELERIGQQERKEKERIEKEMLQQKMHHKTETVASSQVVRSRSGSDKQKRLQSVDATGHPVINGNAQRRNLENDSHVEQKAQGYQKEIKRQPSGDQQSVLIRGGSQHNTPQRQGSQQTKQPMSREGSNKLKEGVYLTAVDATGQPVIDRNKPRENEYVVHASRNSQKQNERHSSIKQTQSPHSGNNQDRRQYNNIAANIDPTYEGIDTLKSGINRDQEKVAVQPNSIPMQNQKRSSVHEGEKKKKKFFSIKKK